MKKFNELKPYYMSLNVDSTAQPMKLSAVFLLHGIFLMFALAVVLVSP